MRGTLMRAGLRDLSTVQVRHVGSVRYRRADGQLARLYREVERDFGILAPPLILHAPAPDVLAAVWLMLRETLLVDGTVSRGEKEAVCAAVSAANECPFCVTIHTAMVADLIGYSAHAINDPAARAAAEWAVSRAAPVADPGIGPAAGVGSGLPESPPVSARQAPEMVGTAVTLEYLNRMVNIFLGEAPLPPRAPAAVLAMVRPVLVRLMKGAAQQRLKPGATLDLLPAAELPADLRWAEPNAPIADAFARAAAVIDAGGERSAPAEVRELVREQLAKYGGRPPGLSRAWVQEAVAPLRPGARAAGRLALLTALASYQVEEEAIADFRAADPADSALIELTAWASLTAARFAGARMPVAAGGAG